MGEFAFVALRAGSLLEEHADHRLGIGSFRYPLCLHRSKDHRQLLQLVFLLVLVILLFGIALWKMTTTIHLLLYLLDVFLLFGALFIL